MSAVNPILLFDGECKFCSFWVQFIKKRKPKNQFQFLPLQSETGKELLHEYKVNPSIDSVVFIWKEKAHIKSNAAFQILIQLGGFWNLLLVFWLIPRPIRDWMYDLVARNRHRFVKNNNCEIH